METLTECDIYKYLILKTFNVLILHFIYIKVARYYSVTK